MDGIRLPTPCWDSSSCYKSLGCESLMTVASLPRPLRRLKPHEVEDVLCIFKNRFGATTHGVRQSWCG